MNDDRDALLLGKLIDSTRTGRLNGLDVEYWIGGGLPPPWCRSDQFRLCTDRGIDCLRFASRQYDEKAVPSAYLEVFRLGAEEDEVKQVCGLLSELHVFDETWLEEQDNNVADQFTLEIALREGKQEWKKTFFEFPEALTPLAERVQSLVDKVKQSGVREVIVD